jgi:Uma2 family endonuclease
VRYELIDGMYLLTPPPALLHQVATAELSYVLRQNRPADCRVLLAPMDYRPTPTRSLQPDVMVATRDDLGPDALCMPLLLAVEVTSPETQMIDLCLKRAIYEESGISSYWLFDPGQEVLTVLELVDGRYVERAVVKGEDAFEAEVPFPVRISPAGLLRGGL